ncbi:transglutaminase-like superfamily protein [Kordia sp. SMS9]|uniref:transglutaminase-like domain-containing protein n=1 Tax=Kordia sp. SMS9 TaxID=2282170 RepID=UPI000E0E01E6|nr:transglutaminase-like domain-containing protein [Kordia sp. SMS9]AXG71142.1 transglutaminase-like superfamily protein [Kordia sp. SMS9]
MNTAKEYVEPTNLVDFNTPIVKEKALELIKGCTSKNDMIKKIYHYVRDEIPYTFTHNLQKASDVLKHQAGQCNTKTTLTIALLRAVNIPARYHCGSVSKKLFINTIPKWAYLFTPKLIPGHCWAEVFINDTWTAIENVVDLKLYEGIQCKMLDENQDESIGCGLSKDKFQKEWDGETDILMQDGALEVDAGIFSNADEYLAKAENFLNPIKRWVKNTFVKNAMNRKFNELRKYANKS